MAKRWEPPKTGRNTRHGTGEARGRAEGLLEMDLNADVIMKEEERL